MRKASVTVSVGLSVLLTLALSACDVDLFGNDGQPLVEPYGIVVVEGNFYLIRDRFESGTERRHSPDWVEPGRDPR
jgi:hypothetical protein